MTGLVAKSRREKQNIMSKFNKKQREETKKFGGTTSQICECGTLTAGIFKDGKLRCHKCKQIL